MTSHAAQGLTVDKVFVAGAISREGLYVSATRGREARPSAMEFVRQHALGTDLRSVLTRGWRHLLHVRAHFAASLSSQEVIRLEPEETIAPAIKLTPKLAAARRPADDDDDDSRPRSRPARQSAPGMRMRF